MSRLVLSTSAVLRHTLDLADDAAHLAQPERGAAYISATLSDLERQLARLRKYARS